MSMINSVILEGVVSVGTTEDGCFRIYNVRNEGGKEVNTYITCILSEGMKRLCGSKITPGRKVHVVGYLSPLGIFAEYIELKDRVVKSGKYTFTND